MLEAVRHNMTDGFYHTYCRMSPFHCFVKMYKLMIFFLWLLNYAQVQFLISLVSLCSSSCHQKSLSSPLTEVAHSQTSGHVARMGKYVYWNFFLKTLETIEMLLGKEYEELLNRLVPTYPLQHELVFFLWQTIAKWCICVDRMLNTNLTHKVSNHVRGADYFV